MPTQRFPLTFNEWQQSRGFVPWERHHAYLRMVRIGKAFGDAARAIALSFLPAVARAVAACEALSIAQQKERNLVR